MCHSWLAWLIDLHARSMIRVLAVLLTSAMAVFPEAAECLTNEGRACRVLLLHDPGDSSSSVATALESGLHSSLGKLAGCEELDVNLFMMPAYLDSSAANAAAAEIATELAPDFEFLMLGVGHFHGPADYALAFLRIRGLNVAPKAFFAVEGGPPSPQRSRQIYSLLVAVSPPEANVAGEHHHHNVLECDSVNLAAVAGERLWSDVAHPVPPLSRSAAAASTPMPNVPFNWALGTATGPTINSLRSFKDQGTGPVLHAGHIDDRRAMFLADPFLELGKPGELTTLFEVLGMDGRGVIAAATSHDQGKSWRYDGTVLEEPHHLSFPYIVRPPAANREDGSFAIHAYMVPEAHRAGRIGLYRTTRTAFPFGWELHAVLLEGAEYQDNGLVGHAGRWYLFTTVEAYPNQWRQSLFVSEGSSLLGPYAAHPASPVTPASAGCTLGRLAGRILDVSAERNFGGTGLIRFSQVSAPQYGNGALAHLITRLTPREYAEQPLSEAAGGPEAFLRPSRVPGSWNENMMHHFDAVWLNGSWFAIVDGAEDGGGLTCSGSSPDEMERPFSVFANEESRQSTSAASDPGTAVREGDAGVPGVVRHSQTGEDQHVARSFVSRAGPSGAAGGTTGFNGPREPLKLTTPEHHHETTDVVVIGAGPMGLKIASELKNRGVAVFHLERGQIGDSIMRWFPGAVMHSPLDMITVAGIPIEECPTGACARDEYLAYLRRACKEEGLVVRTFDGVASLTRDSGPGGFYSVQTASGFAVKAQFVVVAVGTLGVPKSLGSSVAGVELPHVSFTIPATPHMFFGREVSSAHSCFLFIITASTPP